MIYRCSNLTFSVVERKSVHFWTILFIASDVTSLAKKALRCSDLKASHLFDREGEKRESFAGQQISQLFLCL